MEHGDSRILVQRKKSDWMRRSETIPLKLQKTQGTWVSSLSALKNFHGSLVVSEIISIFAVIISKNAI